MASSAGSHSRWATFSGLYSRLAGVRASGWSKYFEECMVAVAEAQELEESLCGVEASIPDLISAEEVEGMAKTFDFGPSLMIQEMNDVLEIAGYIPKGKGRPPEGETVPKPSTSDAVVFKDFFACGFCILALKFLWEVGEFQGTTPSSHSQWHSCVEQILLGLRVLWCAAGYRKFL